MPLMSRRNGRGNGVLLLQNLHDQFLSLILEKLNPGHEASMSICISSCRQGEGVSTIVFNMAAALSRIADRRILLVDSNTRYPKLHTWFKVASDSPGLIDVLEGRTDFSNALIKETKGTLGFIPVGSKSKHPIVLYDSERFDDFLDTARSQFDIILFDAPALMAGPETTVMARKLDGFIMVIEAERTRWEVAGYHKKQLTEAGVRFTGAILNKKKMFIPNLVYRLLLAD